MKFSEIPKFTKTASYSVTTPWEYIEDTLVRYGTAGTILDMDPPFQRAHVWDEEKQRRYVEYILRGGKSGRDIYWNHPNWQGSYKGVMHLVDGKQRLEAVRKFLRNELPIFNGNFFNDFDGRLPWDASFTFHVNDLATYKEVLQWYIDLNDGGVAHTKEEIQKVRDLLEEERSKAK